jgi:predicted MFS family arabinose efflux permease
VSPAPEGATLRRTTLIVGAGVLATTLAQPGVLRLPLQQVLKTELGVSPHEMAAFFAAAALAWYAKPLAGILSDSVPLFGTRRRHYLALSGLAAAVLWLLVAAVPRTYATVLAAVVGLNAALVMGSTVTGGLLVEAGQRHGSTGRLTSARYVVQSACVLVGGPLGGLLAARALWTTAVVGAAVAASVVPVALLLLREPPSAEYRAGAWVRAGHELADLVRHGALWRALGLIALVYAAPGFATALYYRQVDTLGFRPEFIGTLSLTSGALALAGAALYGVACRRFTLRRLLQAGIGASALATLGYLFYAGSGSAVLVEAQAGFLVTLAELALMDLAARATPRGSEGLGFALMMSVRNGALAAGDITGAWLIERGWASFALVVVVNACVVALALPLVARLPAALVDHRDEPAATEASAAP